MNRTIIDAFDAFQIADLDDDMVGMCKALVDWMKVILKEVPEVMIPEAVTPENFFKMNPHQPRMELRKNLRKMMAHACKYQQEEDHVTKVSNVYVVVLAATYIYHMPTHKMVDASKIDTDFTRKQATQMLLEDQMSPNWLKEPSGRDFTAIML